MSEPLSQLTERQLWTGLTKIALTMTGGLLIVALVISLVANDELFKFVAINALILAVAVSILANGVLAMLRIVDWMAARRERKHG